MRRKKRNMSKSIVKRDCEEDVKNSSVLFIVVHDAIHLKKSYSPMSIRHVAIIARPGDSQSCILAPNIVKPVIANATNTKTKTMPKWKMSLPARYTVVVTRPNRGCAAKPLNKRRIVMIR